MSREIKQLAIIGPTASGKSELGLKVAKKLNACILSIDSLSIYKEIDIVSAKPSKEELSEVKHFGINVLNPDEYFSVDIFISLYKEVIQKCQKEDKNLVIVGGTSFYLKSLINGLSPIPKITRNIKYIVDKKLKNLEETYKFLYNLDELYMKKIDKHDIYRIEKALLIYEASKMKPSQWFEINPPKPLIKSLEIYNIDVSRDILRQRISNRTTKMIKMGLIDEVCILEQKYSRSPHSMSSIGIVEVLEFLDGKISKSTMIDLISTHTSQLAKRQQTFNKTQFDNIVSAKLKELEKIILCQ